MSSTKKKQARTDAANDIISKVLRGKEKMDFSTREAFNLLRTNISMSFTDSDTTKIIGVTSSIKHEGKTFVALSLGHALAETDKKVIVLDCDMRLPTVAKKLGIVNDPGMSTVLTGKANALDNIIAYKAFGNVDVIPSGKIPPNPSELLSSERLDKVLRLLDKYYDYVILDLPPVTAVTDALVVANATDGMILVVRGDECEKAALADAIRQLKVADARILGFVYNDKDYTRRYYKGYYKKGYYRGGKYKYSRGYYKSYEKSSDGTK